MRIKLAILAICVVIMLLRIGHLEATITKLREDNEWWQSHGREFLPPDWVGEVRAVSAEEFELSKGKKYTLYCVER